MVQEAAPSNAGLCGVHFCIMPLLDPDPVLTLNKHGTNVGSVCSPTFCLHEQIQFSLSMTISEISWGNINSLY